MSLRRHLVHIPRLKIRLLASKDERRVQGLYGFHSKAAWVLQMQMHTISVRKCTCHLPTLDGDMFGDSPVKLVHHLPRQHNSLCCNPKGTLGEAASGFTKLRGAGLKLKSTKYKFFKGEIVYLGHVASQDRI